MTGCWHTCPICGREFFAKSEWLYRKTERMTNRRIYYCSWKCVRIFEEREEKKK